MSQESHHIIIKMAEIHQGSMVAEILLFQKPNRFKSFCLFFSFLVLSLRNYYNTRKLILIGKILPLAGHCRFYVKVIWPLQYTHLIQYKIEIFNCFSFSSSLELILSLGGLPLYSSLRLFGEFIFLIILSHASWFQGHAFSRPDTKGYLRESNETIFCSSPQVVELSS